LAGVAADVILPSITSVMDIGESDLDFALPHDRVPTLRHQMYNMVPAELVTSMRQRTTDRVGKDSEFLDLLRRKELYVTQKEEKTISLVEPTSPTDANNSIPKRKKRRKRWKRNRPSKRFIAITSIIAKS
jgi:hypothetical protein